MDAALRSKLLANTPLAALVRAIAWDERPEGGALPVIILTTVTPGRDYTHGGWDGLNETRVQFDIWADEADTAAAIAAAMPAAIEPIETIDGWAIGPAFLESDSSDRDEIGGKPVFRRSQDWMIMNSPETPQ